MEKKIDEIRDHIYEIKLDLKEHMKRTEQNEIMIKLLSDRLDDEEAETAPVKKAFHGAKWSIGALLLAGSLATMIMKIFS